MSDQDEELVERQEITPPEPEPEPPPAEVDFGELSARLEAQAEEERVAAAARPTPPADAPLTFPGKAGPAFDYELRTAGYTGDYSKSDAEPWQVEVPLTVAPSQVAILQAVFAAHDPEMPLPLAATDMPDITDGQFGEGLWREGITNYDQYLAFVGPGEIPPPLMAILKANLPDDETGAPTPLKVAVGLITRAITYQFDNPLVAMVRAAMGWSEEKLRDRWLAWSKL